MRFLLISLLLIIYPCTAHASDWVLDSSKSEIRYISIKNGGIAEVNRFRELVGSVSAGGDVVLDIALASVDTGVDIRDQRVRNLLFEVGVNPQANITTNVDIASFDSLSVGDERRVEIDFNVNLHGVQLDYFVDVLVSRLSDNRVRVASVDPVIIDALDFDFLDGLEQLRGIAGLDSISPAVPVTFSLVFDRK